MICSKRKKRIDSHLDKVYPASFSVVEAMFSFSTLSGFFNESDFPLNSGNLPYIKYGYFGIGVNIY